MTTTATNLGAWVIYVPDPIPAEAPAGALFCKRNSDGVDWYAFLKTPPAENTVMAVALQENGYWTIQVATKDPSRLWPAGQLLLSWVDASSDDPSKYVGMVWSGGNIVPRPTSTTDLKAYAATARYTKECGGLTINGHVIATDDRSKSLIAGALLAAQRNPAWTAVWQEADGAYNVDATSIAAMFDAVQAHVNACFTKYAEVVSAIDAGTMTTNAMIDEAFASVAV